MFQRLSEELSKVLRILSESCTNLAIFSRSFPKIAEDCEDLRGRSENVSIVNNTFLPCLTFSEGKQKH